MEPGQSLPAASNSVPRRAWRPGDPEPIPVTPADTGGSSLNLGAPGAVVAGVAALLLVALAIVLLGGLTGGGGSSSPLSPIAQAAEHTASYPGARFSISGDFTIPGAPGNFTMNGSGELNGQQNAVRMDVTTSGLPQIGGFRLSEIYADNVAYLSSPLFAGGIPGGKTWMKLDAKQFGASDQDNTDPRSTLKELAAAGNDFRSVGPERVRNAVTTHYVVTVDPAKQIQVLRDEGQDDLADELQKSFSTTAPNTTIDVWIDKNQLVRREDLHLNLPIAGQTTSMEMSMEFFDFGVTPQITPPPDSDVFDATDLAKQSLDSISG